MIPPLHTSDRRWAPYFLLSAPILAHPMQAFPLEPALDYSALAAPRGASLARRIASARRCLRSAAHHVRRAARRLAALATGRKARDNARRKLVAVLTELQRAVDHAPVLALVAASTTEEEGEQLDSRLARQTNNMTALLKHLLSDVERDLECARSRRL